MSDAPDPDRLLRIYLQDHHAGAAAGIALAGRIAEHNDDRPLGRIAGELAEEITADRDRLEAIMARLGVEPNLPKQVIGKLAVAAGQLKGNGRLFAYSPSSRVIELEGLAAGIITKRSLWQTLLVAAEHRPELDADELDALIERATGQYERVMGQHRDAVVEAFTAAAPATST